MCIFVSFTSVILVLDWISHRLRIIFVKRNDFEMFELKVARKRAKKKYNGKKEGKKNSSKYLSFSNKFSVFAHSFSD